jgi:ATP-binding cassette, subfamily B, bacterial PglK
VRDTLTKLFLLFEVKDRIRILLLFILMIVGALFQVAGIGAIPAFVALVANTEKLTQYPAVVSAMQFLGIATTRELLIWSAASLILIFVIKNVYMVCYYYIKTKFLVNRRLQISMRLFTAYMHAPYTFHLQRNSSELLRNVGGEVGLVINVLTASLQLIMNSLMIAAIFIMLFIVEPLISVVTIMGLGLTTGIFLRAIRQKVKAYGSEQQHHRTMTIKTINEGLGGVKDTKLRGREHHFINNFFKSAKRYVETTRYMSFIGQLPGSILEIVAVGGMLLITTVLVLQGREIETVVPVLALFGISVLRLMPLFKSIASGVADLRFNAYAVDPVYDDIVALRKNTLANKMNGPVPASPLPLKNVIRVENVHFRYPNTDAQALRGVDLAIPKGLAVAFVGPSGAGKTTIVDVLLGLLTPDKGTVNVDGVDIQTNLRGWQSNLGYVPQFIYLIDDTIRRNIAFGMEDAEIDEEKINEAVRAAQLEEFVYGLQDGLDTYIGEGGVRLSGGQRQRIGIARALYNDPEVLVMDEATSALDNVTERYIIDAIDRLRGGRTIVMIAHRLSTVRNCDILFYLEDGKIAASGSFDELLKTSSEFRNMAVST